MAPMKFANNVRAASRIEEQEGADDLFAAVDVDVDIKEIYFLILHFLSSGPCQKTFRQLLDELLEYQLLPRRYHAWYSRDGAESGHISDDGISFPLNYDSLVKRFPHIENSHLVKLLRQLMLKTSPPLQCTVGRSPPGAADVPTLLGTGNFSLLNCDRTNMNKQSKRVPSYLRWPHMQSGQVRGLGLREIGGGFPKHHRAPSIRSASYAVAKPSTMVQKMQNIKKLRGHRDAVYCAIFDRSGRYVITGSDDRLVKIWSVETAFCLSSCRGHEGDITDLAVSSNNFMVASASNDFSIRVWRLPDGCPISVLQGHTGVVTAVAFSPRPDCVYQLLSSSDDGTCRIWDARNSNSSPRIYLPRPVEIISGKTSSLPLSNVASSSNNPQSNQILCCAYNANGTVFVTGSSDTHARVWSAFKSSSDDPEKPIHEIDLLSGHENDVNYVQFSGCAVAPRYSTSDMMEEKGSKFKNSWFSHDNIVTCSRDGSAIIWAPKSHRTQGKMGRWVRAYHLKVPPPPMPPQPPRGGPRQRFLPTPRGVNMIVWSLDNRFVLAAIMDCRICVWNASDGSLVHSLTGHTASTYVLDVHPFNPRIAMSAGYDGKTIVWDIWEGIPIWTYEIGRFKLVDGKFSQDGTSIVLSDEVGQIYFLNTGQGESQKDAKYDQFFLGDYRPLIQDTHGNAVDQETQLLPYQRNIQDRLCDSSMLPYPEPYQSTYQRRRLGAMKIDFRPSNIKLAVGTDIGLGQDFQILPLADLDMVVDPLPDFADAMYWEPPENEVIRDSSDSEYLVTDGNSSEEEGKEHPSDHSVSDPECREAIQKDGLRRSKRKKTSSDGDFSNTGRRMKKKKKKKLSESEGPSTRSKKTKKRRNGRKYSSRRKSTEGKLVRPQRLAAQNAVNGFYQASKFSTDEEVEESLEDYSSGADSSAEGTKMKNRVLHHLRKEKEKQNIIAGEKGSYSWSGTIKSPEQIESSKEVGNRKRLVLKFTMRKPEPSLSENKKNECDNQANTASFCQSALGPSSICETKEPLEAMDSCQETQVDSGEMRVCTESQMELRYPVPTDDIHPENGSIKAEDESMNPYADLESGKHKLVIYKGKQVSEASELEHVSLPKISAISKLNDAEKSSISGEPSDRNIVKVGEKHSDSPTSGDNLADRKITDVEPNEIKKPKVTIIKIKSTRMMQDSASLEDPFNSNGNLDSGYPYEEPSPASSSEDDEAESSSDASSNSASDEDVPSELPDVATDAVRRKRSLRLKATTRETDVTSQKHNFNNGCNLMGSRWTDFQSRSALDSFPSRGMSMSTVIPRSSRSKGESYFGGDRSALAVRNLKVEQRKSSWLLLTEQEEGYRYIPQLRDEVVYLRQGHQESFESGNRSRGSPWTRYRNMRPVEACTVEELTYSTIAGSGEGGCEISFRFIDSSSEYFGQKFRLTLPELVGSPDFIVERTWYEASVNRNWSLRDKCSVWWKDDSEEGGCWWDGRVVSIEDKSADFPDSPWERYTVRYKSETESSSRHSPWELHDLDKKFEHPCIDPDARDSLLASFNKLLQTSRYQDDYGLLKLQEACEKKDFINKFPVPLSPEIIKLRLECNYYRALDSVEHDVDVMIGYARSYFGRSRDLSAKMTRLREWFHRKISKL